MDDPDRSELTVTAAVRAPYRVGLSGRRRDKRLVFGSILLTNRPFVHFDKLLGDRLTNGSKADPPRFAVSNPSHAATVWRPPPATMLIAGRGCR